MRGLTAFFCASLACLSFNSFGQTGTNPVQLGSLLLQVDQRAPQLLTDAAAISIRQSEAKEVRSAWLPNLNLNYQADAGTNNNVPGPYFGLGIVPSNSSGVRTTSNTNTALVNLGIASLDWEVYNFGGYHAQNQLASSAIRVEQSHYGQSKYSLESYAVENYLQLLRLYEFLTIQQKNIIRNQQIIHTVVVLAKTGLRAGVDTSIADAELSKARLIYIELAGQYQQQQQKLALVSGLPAQYIIPDTSLESKLIGRSAELGSLKGDTLNHPLIAYYQSLYQNSQASEELVRKSYNPKLSLEASAWGRGSSLNGNDQFEAMTSGWGFDRSNYLVGLSVSYNLTGLRRRQLKLRTEKLNTEYAFRQLGEQKAILAASSSEASTELTTSTARLDEIPRQLKAARDAYRQKFSLYKNGLTDIIELDAALNILYRAETDFSLARNQFAVALFQKALTENQLPLMLNLLN